MHPNDQFAATLDGVDDRLVLHWATIREKLNRVPEYDLEIYSAAADLDISTLLGTPVDICVARTDGSVRIFHGIFVRIRQVGVDDKYRILRAVVAPKLWLAQQTRDCRIFPPTTIPDLIKQVIDPKYVPVQTGSLQADAYKPWDYLVQYRESDLNFVCRLMEREGIAYYFKHEAGKCTMVLADSISGYAAVPHYDVVPVIPSGAATAPRDHVREWHTVHETRSALVTLSAHEFRFNAGSDITGTGRPDAGLVRPGEADLELYDYAEHYIVEENKVQLDGNGPFSVAGWRHEGERYASARAQEKGVDRVRFEGHGNLRGLEVGALFKLDDPDAPENQLLVVSTEYTYQNHRPGSSGGSSPGFCEMAFTAIEENVPFRPARLTPKPMAMGPETAVVIGPKDNEISTDKYGRVQVRFFWDRQDLNSCWLRVAQPWAGSGWGGLFVPRVGQEVVVQFLGGDPDRPLVTGAVYNASNLPPYDPSAHPTVSTIKSRSTPKGSQAQYNEVRFEDKKGSEQLFIHGQGRMDLLVRGSLYETAGGNREETVGHDDKGDLNRLVANDVNQHIKGGFFDLVDKKLNQNVKQEVVEVFEDSHTVAVTNRQTLNGKEIAVEAKQTLSLKGDTVTAQGAQALSLKAGNVKIEGTQSVSLKCGGSFVVLSPSGVFITGSTVFINTGGSAQPADAPLTIQDPTLETPIDAASATSGLPDTGGGGGGGGGGARTRTSRTVPLQRAPNPPPPPPLHPTIVPGATGPQAFLTIQWGQEKTYCGGPASLSGTTSNYPDGSAETAEVRNVVDGATVVGVPLGINGNAFNQNVEVKDWLPRKSGDDYETSRDEDAFAAGKKTPKPLKMVFIPTAPGADCTLVSPTGVDSHFHMEVANYVCKLHGDIKYVKGYMRWIIQLGNTVPAGTGGQTGVNWGAPNPNSFSGSDWRFARSVPGNKLEYWDGSNWQPVPAAWSDPNNVKLYGIGVWREGAQNKAQFGNNWPSNLSTWGAAEEATASATLPTWKANTAAAWTNKFDMRRHGCASGDQHCCRYSLQVSVDFTAVATRSGHTIVLAADDGRSNAGAWSMGDSRPGLAPHEFGHHLGNPDEYPGGVGIDTSVNTDGATAGIDGTCLMGSVPNGSVPPIKARHLNIIKQHLANLIKSKEGVSWTFDVFPHI